MGLKNIINEALANYPGKERIQELQNIDYQNNPTDMSIGPASNFRHSAAMNELSKSLSPMNNKVGNFVGDSLAYGLGAINEVPDMFRGVNLGELASGIATMNPNTFKGAFNPETLAAAREDLDANYMGTYGTPNSSTIEDVFARTLGYQAPTNTNMQTASTRPGYGAVQASELTNLERDFPGMSTGDIIDSMNNRQAANRYSGMMGQVGPVKSDMAAPRALDMERFAGVSKLGRNDADVEQVEYLGTPSKFQNFKSKAKTGWEGLKGGLQSLFDKTMVGRVLGGIGNMFEDRQLTGDVMDEYGNMYSAADLNKQNALGGYYTDPARSARRRTSRIANMRQRLADKKKVGSHFDKLVAQEKAQQLRNAKDAADKANIQNIQNYTGQELSGYRMDRPASERGFTGRGKSGMGRDPSDKMARGGRVRFSDGGLATLFTRRG